MHDAAEEVWEFLVLDTHVGVELATILVFFGLDVVWRRLVINEGGYIFVDLALFAVLESGFLLADKVTKEEGFGGVAAGEVFTVLLALTLYLVLLFVFIQAKQENIEQMTKEFVGFLDRLSSYQEEEIAAAEAEERPTLYRRHQAQREQIEHARALGVDTVWVNIVWKNLQWARRERAEHVVGMMKAVSKETEGRVHAPRIERVYVGRKAWRSSLAGACTLGVLAAAVWPV